MTDKTSKIRPNSKMDFIVNAFNAGHKKTAEIAKLLAEAEANGTVTGLKKTDEAALAKKTDSYYRKTVNWYLNQAKHKKLIDAPFSIRVKRTINTAPAVTPVAEPVVETSAPVADSAPAVATESDDLIPSI